MLFMFEEIPRKLLDKLADEIEALSEYGRELVSNLVKNAEWQTIEELEAVLIDGMNVVCDWLDSTSGANAALFYDEVRENTTTAGQRRKNPHVSEASPERDPSQTTAAVVVFLKAFEVDEDIQKLTTGLQSRADYEARRSAGETIIWNARRDPLKPKWARVPGGHDSCKFCIMLASRGFEYKSKETASTSSKTGGHYHANCRCVIVPSFNSVGAEGYDPSALYDQWRGMEAIDEELKKESVRAEIKKEGLSIQDVRQALYKEAGEKKIGSEDVADKIRGAISGNASE